MSHVIPAVLLHHFRIEQWHDLHGASPCPQRRRLGRLVHRLGTSVGLSSGTILRPWFRFPGQASYIRGRASIPVLADGTFAWQRRTSKTMYIVVKSNDSSVASNRIVVPAR